MVRVCWLIGSAAAGLALALAAPAGAQTDPGSQDVSIFGWSLAATAQARVAPDYMGSNNYRLGPGGSLSFYRPGTERAFGTPDESPSLDLIGDKTLSAGVLAKLRSGRDNKDDLRGFDRIDWAAEPGVFVNWWPVEGLRVRGELRRGFGGNKAWMADLSADAVHRDERWMLSVGPRLHWADSHFTRTYFDVTPVEAARSPFGIAAYTANGSFTSAGLMATAEYRWSRRWSLLASADYHRLMGDAAKSPIVATLGARDQFSAAFGFRYALGR